MLNVSSMEPPMMQAEPGSRLLTEVILSHWLLLEMTEIQAVMTLQLVMPPILPI